ncbi:MAG: ATP-binding protein [Alphaproteobacteria bacterium]|nr:ATP-binding protein [Alphaproteobacteria bacterium]
MCQMQPLDAKPNIYCALDLEIGSLHLQFPATDDDVSQAMAILRQSLQQMELAIEDIEKAELTLAEALNNVVEHAVYPDRNSQIFLRVEREQDTLICLIRDKGRPLPGAKPPVGKPVDPNVARNMLPEGGFGWIMIQHLTKSLKYRRIKGENHLELVMPLANGPECPDPDVLGPHSP